MKQENKHIIKHKDTKFYNTNSLSFVNRVGVYQ